MRPLVNIDSRATWTKMSMLMLVVASIAGCGGASTNPVATSASQVSANSAPVGMVYVHQPPDSFVIDSGKLDEHGRPVMVNCGTCHASRPPNPTKRLGDPLELFHQEVRGRHGNLSCLSCHHPDDGYRSLRLADGSRVARSDVMMLCAQCHGLQFRDYQRGAHGGMAGHWDLSKGSRERNNCVDCHQAHSPAYPIVLPARGPNDRFLKGDGHE